MSETTALLAARPDSQTEWHNLSARAHRHRGRAGDEAAAITHEHMIRDIRDGSIQGNSKGYRLCPCCFEKGANYMLLSDGHGQAWCGACRWPRE